MNPVSSDSRQQRRDEAHDDIEIVRNDGMGRIDVVGRDVDDWSSFSSSVDVLVSSEVFFCIFDVDD